MYNHDTDTYSSLKFFRCHDDTLGPTYDSDDASFNNRNQT